MLLKMLQNFIDQHHLFTTKSKLLVAVSGGVDSMVLLHALDKLGYTNLYIAHCNFNLRATESLSDEVFVREYAAKKKIPFFVQSFDTLALCKQNKLSIQEQARQLRYSYFEEIRRENNLDYILTAHHGSDRVEGFFINFLRGTGLKGLVSLSPKNNYLIRPLLCWLKKDVLSYAQKNDIVFRTDSSNAKTLYVRNFLRINVLPLLWSRFPAAEKTFLENIHHLAAEQLLLDHFLQKIKQDVLQKDAQNNYFIVLDQLKKYPATPAILYHLLNFTQINAVDLANLSENIFTKTKQQIFETPTHQIILSRGNLFIQEKKQLFKNYFVIDSFSSLPTDLPVALKVSFFDQENLKQHQLKEKNAAFLDASKIEFPLILRTFQKGDYIVPFGSKGKKMISDFFIDKKYNYLQKQEQWFLCRNHEIIWILGETIHANYAVTDVTKVVLKLNFY